MRFFFFEGLKKFRTCSITGLLAKTWRKTGTIFVETSPNSNNSIFLIFWMVFFDSSLNVLNSPFLLKSAITDSVRYSVLSVFTKSRTLVLHFVADEHRWDILNVTPTDMMRKSARRYRGVSPACGQFYQKTSASSTRLRKDTKDEETRSALPRGSVIQQKMTMLASIATRSTATQTSDLVADGRSQHWLSIQGKTGWSSKGRSTVSSRLLSNLGMRVGG